MGAGQSGGVEIGGSPMGYQVLRVYPDSPGSKAGLKAYFDFIVAIGNTRFSKEDGSLREILKASVDQKIKMFVYNTRNKMVREVEIVPTTSWGGSGLLGVSIKHSSFDKADERVWHVTEVDPGSPAQQAGFKAMNDYVIGSDSILQENDDLYNLIEAHEGKALKLFVYNVETDNCREIICHPNSKWGGRGFLGCEFGHGLLHRIPFADTTPGGETERLLSSQQSAMIANQQTALNCSSAPPMQANLLQQQAAILNRTASQPGQQLFQQALFNNQSPPAQQQKPQEQAKPVDQNPMPEPPQAPQTFAQLASAQFQAQQYQQQTAQIQQQQQLLEQQRLQLEQQQRQMEQMAAARQSPPTAAAPPATAATNIPSQPNEQAPSLPPAQQLNYQQGPPPPPPPQQQQQQHPPPSQQSPPPQMAPPPQAPPMQLVGQQQQQQQSFMPHQPSPYQHQYPYGGMQSQLPDLQQGNSGGASYPNESALSSLPPAAQTLPPPPTMYPPPPQAPPSQQQQSQAQPQSQPPPPPPPQQQPPIMFANQM